MGNKFEFFIDGKARKAWEEAEWSELVDRFAIAYTDPEGQKYPPCQVAWPVSTDPSYGRLASLYSKAGEEMRKAGSPYAQPVLIIIRVPANPETGYLFRGTFARFFADRLHVMIVNAQYADIASDEEVLGMFMHEMLHAGLYGVDDPVLRNGHGTLWYRWADILDRKYGYPIFDL